MLHFTNWTTSSPTTKMTDMSQSTRGDYAEGTEKSGSERVGPTPLASAPLQGQKNPPAPPSKAPTVSSSLDRLVGSFFFASVSKSAVAPLERVRLILQTQSVNSLASGEEHTIKTTIECVKRIYSDQGVLAFWKGNMVVCLKFFPQHFASIYLQNVVNNQMNKVLPAVDSKTPTWSSFVDQFLRGGVIGSVSALVCYPMDVFQTLIATDLAVAPRFSGLIDCIVKTHKIQGLSGFFTGWPSSVIGIFVYRFGQLCTHKKLQELTPRGATGAVTSFLIALFSRVLVSSLTFPLDTVRRLQILDASKSLDQREFKNTIDCFQKVLSKEGVLGFYNGFAVDLIRGFASTLLLLAIDFYFIKSRPPKAVTKKTKEVKSSKE
jgi:solute carrier family 25 (adenine nucleotide translocator) protein 4/5/6/31